MASLKEKYKHQVKFYFIEYNLPEAQSVIGKFGIKSHPQTFFIDVNDQLSKEIKGYDMERDDIEKEIILLIKNNKK